MNLVKFSKKTAFTSYSSAAAAAVSGHNRRAAKTASSKAAGSWRKPPCGVRSIATGYFLQARPA